MLNVPTEAKRSLSLNVLLAVIGIVFALSLATQFHWGPWGLVASLTIFPSAGWILADWHGFVASLERAWQKAVKIPEAILKAKSFISKVWVDLEEFHQATKFGYEVILWSSHVVLVWVLVFFWDNSVLKQENVAAGCVASVLGLLIMPAISGLVAETERGNTARKILKERGVQLRSGETIEFKYPGIWAEAEAKTRAEMTRLLKLWNPLVAPFTILYWLVVKVLPYVFWTTIGVITLTYFYANSDVRRIAFSSIALGMIVGFVPGYYWSQPIVGTLFGGVITGAIGIWQHQFFYQRRCQIVSDE